MRNFWMSSWSEDKDVHTEEDITAVAGAAGMSEEAIEECLAVMNSGDIKTMLKVG